MEQNKEKNQFNIKTFIKDNAFQISAIVVVVLNLWLAAKLSPLVQSVELLNQRVEALEDVDAITGREYGALQDRLDRIDRRLGRIESKLN